MELAPAGDAQNRATADALPVVPAFSVSWKTLTAFTAAYVTLLGAGYEFKVSPAAITTIWPADAVVFFVLAVSQKRDWPLLVTIAMLADVLVTWLSSSSGQFRFGWELWFAATHVADGAVGAALLQYWIPAASFYNLRHVVQFYQACIIACASGASLGVIAYVRLHPGPDIADEWLHWWSSTLLGTVTVVPTALTWLQRRTNAKREPDVRLHVRLILLNVLLLLVTCWIFGAPPTPSGLSARLPFAIFPLLGLIALQGPPRWAMLSSTVMILLAVAQTNRGLGPFVNDTTPYEGILALQIYLALAAAMTFVLAIAASDNRALLVDLTMSRNRSQREARLLREEFERRQNVERQRAIAEHQNLLLAAVIRHTRDFVGIATPDGRVIFVNAFGRRLVGVAADESPISMQIADLFHGREHPRLFGEIIPRVLADSYWTGEITLRTADADATIPTQTEAVRIDGEDGHPLWIAMVSRDVTDQRRLEYALLDAVRGEQQKLGRDVHDGLGQELTGISLMAAGIASSLTRARRPEAAEVADLARMAKRAIANCRAIAHGLSPVAFAAGGLVEVLQELVSLQRRSFGTNAHCQVLRAAPLRLGTESVEHLYRMAQEAIANARRHGQARSIQVTLNIQAAAVRLEILDDGVGITSSPPRGNGMGLRIMQVRAATIGARLSIGAGPRGGTLVTCECPQPP